MYLLLTLGLKCYDVTPGDLWPVSYLGDLSLSRPWTKCPWKKFSSDYFHFPLSISFPQFSAFIFFSNTAFARSRTECWELSNTANLRRTRPQHCTGHKETPAFVVNKIYSNCSFVSLCCIIKNLSPIYFTSPPRTLSYV